MSRPDSFWTAETLALATAGRWLDEPAGEPSAAVGIDTRTLTSGQVFVAIRGEHGDGHAYLNEASAKGAWAAVVDREVESGERGITMQSHGDGRPRMGLLRVGDTRVALLDLARAYRRWLEGRPRRPKIIAVAGSNGKTTTTRLIEAVLSHELRGTASPKSFNNFLGVPLTVLSARPDDAFLICEIGTNAPGEVEALAGVVRPDLAVITSIGREHLEGLGSLEGVAREQAAVLTHLTSRGAALIPADGPGAAILRGVISTGSDVHTFGTSIKADHRVDEIAVSRDGTTFRVDGHRLRIGLFGGHNAINAAAAALVGRRFDLSWESISAALADAKGPEMRLSRRCIGGVEIINDAYNANPDSTLVSIAAFVVVAGDARRRIFILGQMLELGAFSEEAHQEVAQAAADAARAGDAIVLIGEAFAPPALVLRNRGMDVTWAADVAGESADTVAAMFRSGDAVLLKGSRRMGLERVAEAYSRRGT